MRIALAALAALAAGGCTQVLGIEKLHGVTSDASGDGVSVDAPIDVPPAAGTITGIVRRVDTFGTGTPSANAPIAFFDPNDSRLGMATSDPTGRYGLDIALGSAGYVTAGPFVAPYRLTRHYLERPLTAPVGIDIDMYSSQAITTLANMLNVGNHDPMAHNFVMLTVRGGNTNNQPIAGAVVQLPPGLGVVRYTTAAQLSTGPDGIALLFAMSPNIAIDVQATINGALHGTRTLSLPFATNAVASILPGP